MRAKRYFCNTRKHRLLDLKMGLVQQLGEPFGALARACGMTDLMPGTMGLHPPFVYKPKKFPLLRLAYYDVNNRPKLSLLDCFCIDLN